MTPNDLNGQSLLRFADIEILRYTIKGFEDLPLERKLLVYHLSEATLAGRDIIWDQHSPYALRVRHILETVYQHSDLDRTTPEWQALETYLYRVWFASGLHHHYGSDKFVPGFGEPYLREAIERLQRQTGLLLEYAPYELDDILGEIFDPERSPKLTEQSGDGDLVQASAVNFYAPEVRTDEVEAFYRLMAEQASEQERLSPPSYGLNTRLGKSADGELYEQPYRQGGLYGEALERISTHLKAALAYTDTEAQRMAILALVEYYKTGDLELYNRFCILWVQDTEAEIDFINGFTEVYADPLGLKGSWEGLVHIRDHEASQRTATICREAAWFEANAPIDDRFKKPCPVGISATVVTLAMLGGDSYPATPIGINLPNADWIRARHGSKSVTISNIHEAYHRASLGSGMTEAFVPDAEVRAMLEAYEGITEELHTDLHECLGHGSGQLLSNVSPDALGAYASTIEEARADLFALYYMADSKMVELGLLPDAEAYRACYYRYLLNGSTTQLVRIPLGQNIEEAHMRNRALIARYLLECGRADGSVYLTDSYVLVINDYNALRQHIAHLLAEVQRIKSEGDLEAARRLVEDYGTHIDERMHREVLERYKRLNLAPYRGFVNPRLELVWDDDGIVDVHPDYTEGYAEQMLRYSRDYSTLPLMPSALEDLRTPHPDAETLEVARSLRTSLRTAMDGVVSSSMRSKGLHYGINFGLTLEHIERKASTLPKSASLASYLWGRDVRELKLIAQMIWPTETLSFSQVTYLASTSFANVELRDCLCKYLLDRIPHAPMWALVWLMGVDAYADLKAIAYTTLARHFTKGYRLPSKALESRLYGLALESLKLESERLLPEQTSALLCLKRWLRSTPELRGRLEQDPRLASLRSSQDPIGRELAQDLDFELSLL